MPSSRYENHPYARWALASGCVGAAIVAIVFLVVDALVGRPLATPSALAATLFLGEPFDLRREVDALLVAGYTAMHGSIFVGLASVVATILFGRPTRPPRGRTLFVPVALLFFVSTTLLVWGFGLLSGVWLWNELGLALVTAANAAAACGMAAVIGYALRTRWVPRGIGEERAIAVRRLGIRRGE